MVGRRRFALERFDSPRHRSHVAQLFSLGHFTLKTSAEKIAFRRLLADAVIQMRAYSGPASQQSVETSQSALRHVNALADLVHNLAR